MKDESQWGKDEGRRPEVTLSRRMSPNVRKTRPEVSLIERMSPNGRKTRAEGPKFKSNGARSEGPHLGPKALKPPPPFLKLEANLLRVSKF